MFATAGQQEVRQQLAEVDAPSRALRSAFSATRALVIYLQLTGNRETRWSNASPTCGNARRKSRNEFVCSANEWQAISHLTNETSERKSCSGFSRFVPFQLETHFRFGCCCVEWPLPAPRSHCCRNENVFTHRRSANYRPLRRRVAAGRAQKSPGMTAPLTGNLCR